MTRARSAVSLLLLAMVAAALLATAAASRAVPAVGETDLWAAAGVIRPARPGPAPAFQLPDLSGRPVALDRLRGRVVLLYFWATW